MKDKHKQRLIEFKEYFLTKKEDYYFWDRQRCLIGHMKKFYKNKTKKKLRIDKFEEYFGLVDCSTDIELSIGEFNWRIDNNYSINNYNYCSAVAVLNGLIAGDYDEAIESAKE